MNILGWTASRHPHVAGWGSETRPHLRDDGGVKNPINRKEVSHGSVYHTPAPLPIPSPPATRLPPSPNSASTASSPRPPSSRSSRRRAASWKSILYTPWLTFWAFFWQVLSPDRSCRAALKRLAAWMARRGQKLDDEDTGPYCKARARLPESVLHRLMRLAGRQPHQEAAEDWRWCGRRVKVVDGSTAIMPDTAANQKAYPQSPSQKPGLGFPIARFVVIFCLATGSVLEAAIGKYQGKQTGENALFRSLWDELEPGDVVLGDRYYGSYFDIAHVEAAGRGQRVPAASAAALRLPPGPAVGPGGSDRDLAAAGSARTWMDEATYEQIPETMEVRSGAGSRGEAGLPHAGVGPGDDPVGCGDLHEKGSG